MANIKIIGHRGARGLAPENTLASLLKAIEHSVDQIEFDVRVSRDHIPIVIHDPHLQDQAGNKLLVRDHTYKTLLEHKPDLPTLEAVLRTVGRKAVLYIEVKPNEPVKPIVMALGKAMRQGVPAKNLLLASFSFPILAAFKSALPQLSLVVIDRWSGVRATHRARKLGTKSIAMNHRWLWAGFIRAMKRGGYELYPYTMNDPIKVNAWVKHGIAGVVTDFPDRYQVK